MNGYSKTLKAWKEGFGAASERLEELRKKEIRESDIVKSISAFDLAFESASKLSLPRPARALTKHERILLSVDINE